MYSNRFLAALISKHCQIFGHIWEIAKLDPNCFLKTGVLAGCALEASNRH